MTLDEAIRKAETPIAPALPTDKADPYAIPAEFYEQVVELVGKTLNGKLEIVGWFKQNYILREIATDDYKVTPVMWVFQNLKRLQVSRASNPAGRA